MPRRVLRPWERRALPAPDYKFASFVARQFINKLMSQGKQSVAERVFYGALDQVKVKSKDEPMAVLTRALERVRPLLEVKPRRVGGATYQVPIEVRPERGNALAMRWLITAARQRTGKAMAIRLAQELLDAANNEGTAVKKRDDMHKMAEANKAFAHYRW